MIVLQGGDASLLDVLDRVLDKGIVFDTWARISLVDIDLVGLQARIVVAGIEIPSALGPEPQAGPARS